MKLAKPTQSSKEIRIVALDIIKRSWNLKAPIRMLTVTGTRLVDENYPEQLSLFYEGDVRQREKMEKIEDTVDTIRSRYGKGSISFGSSIHKDTGIDDYGIESEE